MLMMQSIHNQIVALLPDIKRTVASVLRSSRYASADHVEDCTADILTEMLDYGARTFDETKGSAKSHFTTFAKRRALNWLAMAHRRYASRDGSNGSDESMPNEIDAIPSETFQSPLNALEAKRIRLALASLSAADLALVEAFEATSSWSAAAQAIGVSAPTATRMKQEICKQLKAQGLTL